MRERKMPVQRLHTPEPTPGGGEPAPSPEPPQPQAPPIEDERGPQTPIREPEPMHEPERVQ
jgi:hypothetical protein